MEFLRILLVLLLILAFFWGCFFFWQGIYLPKESKVKEEKMFKIEEKQNVLEIAENLEKEGLIKNKIFFQVYVFLRGKIKGLQAGTYSFSPSMSVSEIAQKIFRGETIQIRVTIPEGFTIKEIEERINEVLGVRYQILEEKAGKYKKDYEFLKDVPDDFNLEGFLFPDTYFFEPGMKEEEIVEVFLKNFDKKTSQLREEIKKQGKTIFDIVKMASLLEKEVKTLEDKKLVAGILEKRKEAGMLLRVDATITFITKKKTTKVTFEETQIDSPYNTYKYKGLPIGPICNPGLDSILAASYPKKSEYWYYLSTPEGETIFSRTLKEHNLAKAKYLK